MKCYDCPRMCGVDRENSLGYCQESNKIRVAKIIENFMWEEPCISGDKGALAIFFSGCNLKCSFCQNREISHIGKGQLYSPEQFRQLILSYDLTKFSSIDLITPSHFSSLLCETFDGLNLPIPIVWNSNAYENTETVKKVSTFVNVFLPDLKFYYPSNSLSISKASDYFEKASKAIIEMRKNKPINIFSDIVLKEGLLIRHLVVPGKIEDSKKILEFIKTNISKPSISLMSQFTPIGNQFNRKLYPLEYKAVLSYAEKLGLDDGYIQDFKSASEEYIPNF